MTDYEDASRTSRATSDKNGQAGHKDTKTGNDPGTGTTAEPDPAGQQAHRSHLDGLDDCGCVEVWEYLSEQRNNPETTDRGSE